MKLIYRLLIAFCLFSFMSKAFAGNQLFEYSLGAIPPTQEEYESFPRIDWAVLNALSDTRSIQTQNFASGIVRLNTPPIGNQGAQGSCVGWAFSYAVSILAFPKFNNNWNTARRSPSYIFNQIRGNPNDCGVGASMTAGFNLIRSQGVSSWNLMPYNENDCNTQPNNNQRLDAMLNNITHSGTLARNDVAGIRQALDLGFPVVVSFPVYQSFDDMWRRDGIWDRNTGTSRGNHAGTIVGYDDTRQMFKVMNSWGTGGGVNGYFWMTYDLVRNNALNNGVFVLFGINPAILRPSISGTSNVCANQLSTFTVFGVPHGASIVWTSSSALFIAGNNTGSSLNVFNTVMWENRPDEWVRATFFHNGQPLYVQQHVFAWAPMATYNPTLVGHMLFGEFRVMHPNGTMVQGSNFQWSSTVPGAEFHNQGDPLAILHNHWGYHPCGRYYVMVSFDNVCGERVHLSRGFDVWECWRFTAYPNPARETLTISLNNKQTETQKITPFTSLSNVELKLYNHDGQLLRRQNMNVAEGQATINTTDLPAGNYVLHIVVDGEVVERQTIMITN